MFSRSRGKRFPEPAPKEDGLRNPGLKLKQIFSLADIPNNEIFCFLLCRIRATSLLGSGGLNGAGGFVTVQKTAEDEELDVTGTNSKSVFFYSVSGQDQNRTFLLSLDRTKSGSLKKRPIIVQEKKF